MTSAAHRRIALVVIAFMVSGCDPEEKSTGNFYGTNPLPPGAAPIVMSVTPNLGSTGGSAPVIITGSGFQSTVTVTIGGIIVDARTDFREVPGTKLYVETPAHDAGVVDVVVKNRTGAPGALAAAYTYAQPQSFDFNGDWWGVGNKGQVNAILFTIKNNAVVSVSCDIHWTLKFATPVPVIDGAFSYSTEAGVVITGRIVSTSASVGTMNLAPCSATNWGAERY
jgi:hypothetical protein